MSEIQLDSRTWKPNQIFDEEKKWSQEYSPEDDSSVQGRCAVIFYDKILVYSIQES
jgi:hypothetical protein